MGSSRSLTLLVSCTGSRSIQNAYKVAELCWWVGWWPWLKNANIYNLHRILPTFTPYNLVWGGTEPHCHGNWHLYFHNEFVFIVHSHLSKDCFIFHILNSFMYYVFMHIYIHTYIHTYIHIPPPTHEVLDINSYNLVNFFSLSLSLSI
jgi:hypothetical protein